MALSDLQRNLGGKDTELGDADLRKIRGIIMEILEQKLAKFPPSAEVSSVAVQGELCVKVQDALVSQAQRVGCEAGPVLILNAHPTSGVVHVARDAERALCGWEYAKSPWHETVTKGDTKPRRCVICRNAI